jgi:hypothetical protein
VCEQDSREVFESQPRLQDLPLCALTAIDQEAIFIMLDHLRRKPAVSRGRGSGGAEKKNFEQRMILDFSNFCHRLHGFSPIN